MSHVAIWLQASLHRICAYFQTLSWNDTIFVVDWDILYKLRGSANKWSKGFIFSGKIWWQWFCCNKACSKYHTLSTTAPKYTLSQCLVYIKIKLAEGTSIRRWKVTLLFSLSCSVDFFMLSPHNKPAFISLIPDSFTSLNPFVTFFRPLQPHSSSQNSGKTENFRFKSDAWGYAFTRNKTCTRNQVVSEWVKNTSIQSWVELHFTTTSYILNCFWPPLFQTNRISRSINKISENLTSLSIFTLNIKQFLWKYQMLLTLFWTALILLRSKQRKY